MDGRFLGLAILMFVMLAILEASAENFYAFRYGKRDGGYAPSAFSAPSFCRDWLGRFLSSGTEGRPFKSPRYSRRSDVSNDLFLGSRYGKRNATPTREYCPSKLCNYTTKCGSRVNHPPISTENFPVILPGLQLRSRALSSDCLTALRSV